MWGQDLPIPHPKHNCRNRALEHNVQANFSKFWRSSLPIRGIRSCGIEALSNLAPHLKQLHMLAHWGRLRRRLGFRFWNGFGLPIPGDKTVINNIFGEVNVTWMYVTAKLGITTLVMAENHISTKHNLVMSRRTHPKHDTAPVSLQSAHNHVLLRF